MISNVRVAQNNSKPVYRLPTEILVLIFKHALPCPDLFHRVIDTNTLLSVSRVSKSWREVSINTPTLWTRIDVLNARLMRVFISRSRTAPLNIALLPPISMLPATRATRAMTQRHSALTQHDAFARFMGDLKPQMHRLGSLWLDGLPQRMLDQYLDTLAPLLTSLRLQEGPLGSDSPIATEANSPLFFRGETPLLREVEIVGIAQPLTSPMFAGLVSLYLQNIRFTHSTNLHFFQLLIACPLLEDLTLFQLTFSSMVNMSMDSLFSTPIHLPRLRELQFTTLQLEFVRDMLISIRVSNRCCVNVRMKDPATFTDILPSDRMQLESLLRLSDVDHLSVTVHRELSCFSAESTGHDVFTIFFRNEEDAVENGHPRDVILSSMEQRIFLPNLQVLTVTSIEMESNLTVTAFIGMLRHLHTIKSLRLMEVPSCYVETLIVTPERHLCPRLEELGIFRGCDISGERLIQLAKSRIVSNAGVEVWDHHDELPSSLRRMDISGLIDDDYAMVEEVLEDLSIEIVVIEEDDGYESDGGQY